MRLMVMSTLLLVLSVGESHANNLAVPLVLRPVKDIGPQAATSKGPSGEPAVEVTGGATASTTTLIVCDAPAVSRPEYVVRGQVKCDGVVGAGYLELWNDFGAKGAYFTRSLADRGSMKKLSGTSEWRDFELPFHAEPGMNLRRLTLNVVLPGAGNVVVSQPLVVAPLSLSGSWWTEMQAGLLAGGLGGLLGVLGALVGVSTAWGKSRTLAMSLNAVGLAISVVALITGIVALCAGQPWHVCYPGLLVGFIGVTVLGFNVRTIVRRFQDDELRRMTAVDAA